METLAQIKKNFADGISQALQFGDTAIHKAQLGAPETRDAGAYENYLRGKYVFEHKQNRGDVDNALEAYRRALDQDSSLLAARAGIAQVHISLSQYDLAKTEHDAALSEAKERKLTTEEGETLFLLAQLSLLRSDWKQAAEFGQSAGDIKRKLNDIAGEAEVLGLLIHVAQAQADFDQAIRLFDRVLEIARCLDDREKTAEALKNMGLAYSRKGEYVQARDLYDQSLKLAETSENLPLQASCWSNIGNIEFFRGNLNEAYDHYDQAYQIQSRLGNKYGMAAHSLNKGLVQLRRLQFRNGLALLEDAGKTFKEQENRQMYAMVLVNMSQAKLTLGHVEEAEAAAGEAIEIGAAIGHPLTHSTAVLRLAAVEMYKHQFSNARKQYLIALEIANEAGVSRSIAQAEIGLAEACLGENDHKSASKHIDRALAVTRETGEQDVGLKASIIKAVTSVRQGLANTGLDQLHRLLEETRKHGDTELLLFTQLNLGRQLIEVSDDIDKAEGRKLLDDALFKAQEYELVYLIREIEKAIAD